jgi:imidazolonepropionase-like amidohydrolase
MRTVVTGGVVFDGTGSPPEAADVLFQEGRILEVGSGLDGDAAIDATGQTVLPGFIDCHVHAGFPSVDFVAEAQKPFALRYYETAHSLATTLDTGITTVRDAGGVGLGVKEAVSRGLIRGPRMRISLTMLSQTGGHGDDWWPSGVSLDTWDRDPGIPSNLVDGPDEMRKKVRELVRAGADCVKVATSGGVLSPRDDPRHAHFRPAELGVLVEEASAAGIHVLAHAQATGGIRNAVRAGIRSIEHGIYLDESVIGEMLERGTWLVPTLIAPRGVLRAAERGDRIPEWALEKAKAVIETHRASVSAAIAAGVDVAFGTDCPVSPHGTNLDEFVELAALGMTPEQVLRAATSVAAELIGVADSVGTLEPGKRADLVLVDGDARRFEDLRERITGVYQDGRLVGGPAFHGRLTAD